MADHSVLEINDDDFEAEVLNATEPTLVDFWAPWCGPCRAVAPVLDRISERRGLRVVKVNIDQNQATAKKYRVSSIPMMILFKEGEVAKKVLGAMPQRELEEKLAPALGWD